MILRYAPFLLALLLPVSCMPTFNQSYLPRPVDNRGRELVIKGRHYGLKEVDAAPVPVGRLTRPAYPAELRNLRRTGDVVMALVIGVDGRVSESRVIYADDVRFSDSAQQAMATWRFKPARKDGRDVSFLAYMPIRFSTGISSYPELVFKDGI